jgi:hypothetical protein
MQLHWGWAALALLVVTAALIGFTQPGQQLLLTVLGRSEPVREGDSVSPANGRMGPTLYRWVDTRGVVNITDQPPVGRRYTIVHIDPNQNIVPMLPAHADSSASTAH